MTLLQGSSDDPDHPGWYSWHEPEEGRFLGSIGKLLFKLEGPGCVRVRMFPTEPMLNYGGSIHGGAVMTFIDMALFLGGRCAGMAEGHYVTLDCATHFIARAKAGTPLDAIVRLVGQTPGGHVFLSGHCEQDGAPTHNFTGTLKRIRTKAPSGDA